MSTHGETTPHPSVVLGTIGSDAHVVGITLLEHALRDAGFLVRNLGAQTSRSAFAEAAAEMDADAVLVSSLYGHAEQDCRGLHEILEKDGESYFTCIGGNLSVGQSEFADVRQIFREMGFDRVFGHDADFDAVIDTLRTALGTENTYLESESERLSARS